VRYQIKEWEDLVNDAIIGECYYNGPPAKVVVDRILATFRDELKALKQSNKRRADEALTNCFVPQTPPPNQGGEPITPASPDMEHHRQFRGKPEAVMKALEEDYLQRQTLGELDFNDLFE
jgi:hypothetical protein